MFFICGFLNQLLSDYNCMILKKEALQNNQNTKTQAQPKKKMAVLRLEKDIQSYEQEKIDFVKLTFPD